MSDTDPDLIAQFASITGAAAPTAHFFLSAHRNNIDAAVSAFFESDGAIPTARDNPRPQPAAPRPPPPRPTANNPSTQNQNQNPAQAPGRPSRSGVATLGSLRDSNPEDEEEQGYYAGGEKSGQMIQDPPKKNRADKEKEKEKEKGKEQQQGDDGAGPANLTDAIFEQARQRGPRTDEEREQFEGPQSFAGAGYRLGDGGGQPAPRARGPDVVGRRNVTRVLTFYRNGFTVDDSELRRFEDPANEAFLSDVNRGVVPSEMEEAGVGDVSITLVDKKGEDFEEKKKRTVPFSGGGNRLNETDARAVPADVDTQNAATAVTVDETAPIARIQIRLSDGTRVVARFNETHTVADLSEFVRLSRANVGTFVLSTTFPRKVLANATLSIKDAGLNGAVVVQTLK